MHAEPACAPHAPVCGACRRRLQAPHFWYFARGRENPRFRSDRSYSRPSGRNNWSLRLTFPEFRGASASPEMADAPPPPALLRGMRRIRAATARRSVQLKLGLVNRCSEYGSAPPPKGTGGCSASGLSLTRTRPAGAGTRSLEAPTELAHARRMGARAPVLAAYGRESACARGAGHSSERKSQQKDSALARALPRSGARPGPPEEWDATTGYSSRFEAKSPENFVSFCESARQSTGVGGKDQ